LLQEFLKAKGLRHWASLTPLGPCGRHYRPRTTTPFPPLSKVIGVSSRVSPFLLSTLLRIPWKASRVHRVRLSQDDVGGVFLATPSALCGFPVPVQGTQVYLHSLVHVAYHHMLRSRLPLLPWGFGLDWLTYQARYVRGYVSRRAMHASGDSPCHPLAKRYLLGTCLLLIAPFRSMLLTTPSGLRCLAPRAHWVPVYPKVFFTFLHCAFTAHIASIVATCDAWP